MGKLLDVRPEDIQAAEPKYEIVKPEDIVSAQKPGTIIPGGIGNREVPLIKALGEFSERLRIDTKLSDDEKSLLKDAAPNLTTEEFEYTVKTMRGEQPEQQDSDNMFTRFVAGAAPGIAVGGTGGALIGSIVPGAGTAIGAGVGAATIGLGSGLVAAFNKKKRYYFDERGVAHPLAYGQLPPSGSRIESLWGNTESSGDDNPLSSMAKGFYNAFVRVGNAVPGTANVLYNLAAGEDAKWLTDIEAAVDHAQFSLSPEAEQPIFSADKSGEINFTPNVHNMAQGVGSVLGYVAQFVGGAGALKLGKTAEATMVGSKPVTLMDKLRIVAPWKQPKLWGMSTMINMSESVNAARNAGLDGREAAMYSMISAIGVGALEIAVGGEAMRLTMKREIFDETANAFKQQVVGGIKTETGAYAMEGVKNISHETIENLYKATLKKGFAAIAKRGKGAFISGWREGLEEANQDLYSQFVQVMHDKIDPEGKKFGTKMFSPESMASLYNNFLLGFAGGGISGTAMPDKEVNINRDIYQQVKNGTTDNYLKKIKIAVEKGTVTPESYEDAKFRVQSYKKYNDQMGSMKDPLPPEKQEELFGAMWQHENAVRLHDEATQAAEADKINGLAKAKAKAYKQEISKWENEINKIITTPIATHEKEVEENAAEANKVAADANKVASDETATATKTPSTKVPFSKSEGTVADIYKQALPEMDLDKPTDTKGITFEDSKSRRVQITDGMVSIEGKEPFAGYDVEGKDKDNNRRIVAIESPSMDAEEKESGTGYIIRLDNEGNYKAHTEFNAGDENKMRSYERIESLIREKEFQPINKRVVKQEIVPEEGRVGVGDLINQNGQKFEVTSIKDGMVYGKENGKPDQPEQMIVPVDKADIVTKKGEKKSRPRVTAEEFGETYSDFEKAKLEDLDRATEARKKLDNLREREQHDRLVEDRLSDTGKRIAKNRISQMDQKISELEAKAKQQSKESRGRLNTFGSFEFIPIHAEIGAWKLARATYKTGKNIAAAIEKAVSYLKSTWAHYPMTHGEEQSFRKEMDNKLNDWIKDEDVHESVTDKALQESEQRFDRFQKSLNFLFVDPFSMFPHVSGTSVTELREQAREFAQQVPKDTKDVMQYYIDNFPNRELADHWKEFPEQFVKNHFIRLNNFYKNTFRTPYLYYANVGKNGYDANLTNPSISKTEVWNTLKPLVQGHTKNLTKEKIASLKTEYEARFNTIYKYISDPSRKGGSPISLLRSLYDQQASTRDAVKLKQIDEQIQSVKQNLIQEAFEGNSKTTGKPLLVNFDQQIAEKLTGIPAQYWKHFQDEYARQAGYKSYAEYWVDKMTKGINGRRAIESEFKKFILDKNLTADALRDDLINEKTSEGRFKKSQVGNIARSMSANSESSYAGEFNDVSGDRVSADQFRSFINDQAERITDPEIKKQFPNNQLVQNAKGPLKLFLLDGLKNTTKDVAVSRKEIRQPDASFIALTNFFAKKTQEYAGKGNYLQLLDQQADSAQRYAVPVPRHETIAPRQVLHLLQQTKFSKKDGSTYTLTPAKAQEAYQKEINSIADQIEYYGLSGALQLPVHPEDLVDRKQSLRLATDFVHNWIVNKADVDEFFRGSKDLTDSKGKPLSYPERIKRKNSGQGLVLDTNIEGGIGKSHKVLTINDAVTKFIAPGEYESEVTIPDGGLWMMPDFSKKMQVSSGGEFSGQYKAFTYQHIDSKEHLIKGHDVHFPDPSEPDVVAFYQRFPHLLDIFDYAKKHGADRIAFESTTKLWPGDQRNHVEYLYDKEGNITGYKFPDTPKLVEINNENFKVMLDLTNAGTPQTGKLPTQLVNISKSFSNGEDIDNRLAEAAHANYEKFVKQLEKKNPELIKWLMNQASDTPEAQLMLEHVQNGSVDINDPILHNMANGYFSNAIENKMLNINVPKMVLVHAKMPGINMRSIKIKDGEIEHPQSLFPSSAMAHEGNPAGLKEREEVFVIRVPSDNPHSVGLHEVAGFLPASMKNVIITDAGTQHYSGNDQDGDAAHIWSKIKDPASGRILSSKGTDFKNAMNDVHDMFTDFYSDPENMKRITQPIGTGEIKKYLQEHYPTRQDMHPLLPSSWIEMVKSNLGSADVLEQTAAFQKAHFALGSNNVNLSTPIRFPKFDAEKGEWTNQFIDLKGWSGSEEKKVAAYDLIGDQLNHAADDPKNGTLSMMNKFASSTAPVMNHLMSMDARVEKSMYEFMHHPVVEKFIEKWDEMNSPLNYVKKKSQQWDQIARVIITGERTGKLDESDSEVFRNAWQKGSWKEGNIELTKDILESTRTDDKLKVLRFLQYLHTISQDALDVQNVVNLVTNPASQSYGKVMTAWNSYQKLANGELKAINPQDAKRFVESSIFHRARLNIDLAKKIYERQPINTGGAAKVSAILQNELTKADHFMTSKGLRPHNMTEDEFNAVYRGLDRWIMVQALDIKESKKELREKSEAWFNKLSQDSNIRKYLGIDTEGKLGITDTWKKLSKDVVKVDEARKELAKLPAKELELLTKYQVREYGWTMSNKRGGFYLLLPSEAIKATNDKIDEVVDQLGYEQNYSAVASQVQLAESDLIPKLTNTRTEITENGKTFTFDNKYSFLFDNRGNQIQPQNYPIHGIIEKEGKQFLVQRQISTKSGRAYYEMGSSTTKALPVDHEIKPVELTKTYEAKKSDEQVDDVTKNENLQYLSEANSKRDPELAEYIREHLTSLRPELQRFSDPVKFQDFLDRHFAGQVLNTEKLGAQIGKAYWINPESPTQEAEIHEHAHFYWDLLPEEDMVKQRLLRHYGSVENSIKAIGEAGVELAAQEKNPTLASRLKNYFREFWSRVHKALWGDRSMKDYTREMANRVWKDVDPTIAQKNFEGAALQYLDRTEPRGILEFSDAKDKVEKIEKLTGKKIKDFSFKDLLKKTLEIIQPRENENFWQAGARVVSGASYTLRYDETKEARPIQIDPIDQFVKDQRGAESNLDLLQLQVKQGNPYAKAAIQEIETHYREFGNDIRAVHDRITSIWKTEADLDKLSKSAIHSKNLWLRGIINKWEARGLPLQSASVMTYFKTVSQILGNYEAAHRFADGVKEEQGFTSSQNKVSTALSAALLDPESIHDISNIGKSFFARNGVAPFVVPISTGNIVSDYTSHMYNVALRNAETDKKTHVLPAIDEAFSKLKKAGATLDDCIYKDKDRGELFIHEGTIEYSTLEKEAQGPMGSEKAKAILGFVDLWAHRHEQDATVDTMEAGKANFRVPNVDMDYLEMVHKHGLFKTFVEKSYGHNKLDDIHTGVADDKGALLSLGEYKDYLRAKAQAGEITKAKYFSSLNKEQNVAENMFASDLKVDKANSLIIRDRKNFITGVSTAVTEFSSTNREAAVKSYLVQLNKAAHLHDAAIPMNWTQDYLTNFNPKKTAARYVELMNQVHLYGIRPESNFSPMMQKLTRGLINYTGLKFMALNIAAPPFNAAAGFTQNVRDLGLRRTMIGISRFFSGLKGSTNLEDAMLSSKIISIMDQNHLIKIAGKDWTTSSSSAFVDKIKGVLFFPTTIVEVWNHAITVAGAMSKEQWNAYDSKGKIIAGKEKDALNEDQALKLLFNIVQTHGAYNPMAKRLINMTPEGQAVAQLKTWMFDVKAVHDATGRYVLSADQEMKGILRGAGKNIKTGFQIAKALVYEKDNAKAQALYDSLSSVDKYNLKRLGREAAMMALMGMALMSMAGDDEKYKKTRRIWGDIGFIYDLNNWQYLFKSPVPVFSTLVDGIEALKQTLDTMVGAGQVYKRNGIYGDKGDSKTPKYIMSAMPMESFIKMITAQDSKK